MNFLAHHAVALDRWGADAPADAYVGNVLPDLVATSGEGRLRPQTLPADAPDTPLRRGVHLHFETDRRFHGLPAFADAQTVAKRLFRETAFRTPPTRVFFLAHAAVEIALDGLLFRAQPTLTADFYRRFADADLPAVLAQTQAMFPPATPPLLALARTIDRFVASRYLENYATFDGQAHALTRLSQRADIAQGFADPPDREQLTAFFARLSAELQPHINSLLLRSETSPPVVE